MMRQGIEAIVPDPSLTALEELIDQLAARAARFDSIADRVERMFASADCPSGHHRFRPVTAGDRAAFVFCVNCGLKR